MALKPSSPKLPAMTEKRFMAQVVKLAKLQGWLVYHTHDSRHSAAGFPDLVMMRDGEVIFAELKSQRGVESRSQKEWKFQLWQVQAANNTVGVFLWRPSNWPTIERTLSRRV